MFVPELNRKAKVHVQHKLYNAVTPYYFVAIKSFLLLPQVLGAFSVFHARCCARSCKQQVGQRVYPRQGKRIKVKKNSDWTASLIVRHLSSCLCSKQGNMNLPPCSSSEPREEEKLILVNVEELPKQNSESRKPILRMSPSTRLSSETEPESVIPTTYIKSLSHDSDSSDHTHTSLDTTVDYISSHEPGNLDEEDDEEKCGEFLDMPFISNHNIFIEPLVFGGKLTLDAVKIDCSDFFQNA